MAYDLGTCGQITGIVVQACGDCHVENFGIFATPERNVVFDINDFDETLSAPWEWDVKRLAASIHVAARASGTSERRAREAVRAAAYAYRESLAQCSVMTKLEVWYARIDASEVFGISHAAASVRGADLDWAPDDTHELIAEQYTSGDGLGRRIVDKPPKLFHPPPDGEIVIDAAEVLGRYRTSLRDDTAVLFDAYELVDMAVKVVGIGSVGTRCAVALLMAHENDGLILQIKEARRSVLEQYAQPCTFENQGQRVVAGQRIMQTASDLFLGWSDSDDGHQFLRSPALGHERIDRRDVAGVAAAPCLRFALRKNARAHARALRRPGDACGISREIRRLRSSDRAICREVCRRRRRRLRGVPRGDRTR